MSAPHGLCASLPGHVSTYIARIQIPTRTSPPSTRSPAKFSRWNWMGRSSANSEKPARRSVNCRPCTTSIAGTRTRSSSARSSHGARRSSRSVQREHRERRAPGEPMKEVYMSRSLLLVLLLVAIAAVGTSVGAQLRIREIPYESPADVLKGLPDDVYIGEAAGVATNSRGHLFVYTRTGSPQLTLGTERHFHRGAGGARLFEFDQSGKYLREVGQGLYGFISANTLRIDPQDSIWTVDEGSGTIVKFSPQGQVQMVLGRTPEYLPMPGFDRVASGPPPAPTGPVGTGVQGDEFDRPTDVALDTQGNIFVADGHVNARIAKFDANGRFVTSWGSLGTAPGQFNVPHSLVTDLQGNLYVADRENRRIQVFDNNGVFKTQFINVGSP